MASTRFKAATRDAASAATDNTPSQALKTLTRHAARAQIASFSAVTIAMTGWATAVGRLAQTIGDELLQRIDGDTSSHEFATGVVSAASTHLRELTTLPRTAGTTSTSASRANRSTTRRTR